MRKQFYTSTSTVIVQIPLLILRVLFDGLVMADPRGTT
jgi:hypothetical protein